jgi:predicted nucleotidyltransferase
MIKEFQKFVGNRVLGWFLMHPTTKCSINQLARELEVSPASIKRYTDLFIKDGILMVSRAGTAHLLFLHNDESIVQEMKRTCIMLLLREAGITEIARNAISLAVYGSAATGTFDEKSDIDILIIAEESEVDFGQVPMIEEKVGYELQITVIPYYRWEEMKQRGDPFSAGVLSHHVRFRGAEL